MEIDWDTQDIGEGKDGIANLTPAQFEKFKEGLINRKIYVQEIQDEINADYARDAKLGAI